MDFPDGQLDEEIETNSSYQKEANEEYNSPQEKNIIEIVQNWEGKLVQVLWHIT